jgi:hypothetical protein
MMIRASSSSKMSSMSTRPISRVIVRAIVGMIIQGERCLVQRSGMSSDNPTSRQINANKIAQLIIVLFSMYAPFITPLPHYRQISFI